MFGKARRLSSYDTTSSLLQESHLNGVFLSVELTKYGSINNKLPQFLRSSALLLVTGVAKARYICKNINHLNPSQSRIKEGC